MNSSLQLKIRRVEKVSGWLRVFLLVAMVLASLALVVFLAAAFTADTLHIQLDGSSVLNLTDRGTGVRMGVAVAIAFTYVVQMFGLHQMRSLFALYRQREFFSSAVASRLRRFGFACVCYSASKTAWMILILALSPGTKGSLFSLEAAFLGGVFVVISWFVEMAAELREENDLTV